MLTTQETDTDWRKYAAAVTQSDEEIEKAFLDQAWVTLQSKARPLMGDGLRVGFEVVHKNAENTRMVGVFVFRIDKDYLYAPVFFLNGNIKGTDLLYRATPKKFVPLNNDWCDYLVQLRSAGEGQGVPRAMRQKRRNSLNLLDIVEPPVMHRGGRKFASVADDITESDLVLLGVAEMMEKLADAAPADDSSVLRRFITRHGGHSALRKLANTARHDFEFAQALMLGSCPENYMPDLEPPPAKQAAGPLLSVHTCVLRNPNVKSASARDMCRGWLIEDHRDDTQKSAAVYADLTTQMQSVAEPGVYSLLLADGSTTPCLVGYCGLGERNYGEVGGLIGQVPVSPVHDPELLVVRKDTKASAGRVVSGEGQLYGESLGELSDDDQLIDPADAQSGKGYRMVDVSRGKFSAPFMVTGVETDTASGLKALQVACYHRDMTETDPKIVNPEAEGYDASANMLGAGIKLVEVGFSLEDEGRIVWDSNVGTGSLQSLLEFVFENGAKQASVICRSNGSYQVKTARTNQQWSPEYSELSATVRLMLDCAVAEEVANGLLKQAETAREVVHPFLYDGTKQAHNLRFNDWPEFYESANNEFGVLEAVDTKHILPIDYDEPEIREHRIGDVWKQEGDGGSSDTLDTATPMQLYELSQQEGLGSLFEHGVVGELVKSYDGTGMVQSYIPDLEQAVDRLGRTLFLLYWKPEDFSSAYGSDDQSSLENQLVSNFRSLGDLTLELLQKAQDTTEGSSSMV